MDKERIAVLFCVAITYLVILVFGSNGSQGTSVNNSEREYPYAVKKSHNGLGY